jgi:hypothetical protein
VSVPDSARGFGRVYAGGTKYAADGAGEFGAPFLPHNRGLASARAAQSLSISAQIHDPEEADSILLSPEVREARARRRAEGALAASASASKSEAQNVADRARRSQAEAPGEPIRSVADIRREREGAADTKRQEALALVQRGEQAQAEGKPGVARISYQMAARRLADTPRADGDLKSRIAALLESVEPTGKRP